MRRVCATLSALLPFNAADERPMNYRAEAPSRETIDTTPGPQVVSFGANWCGHCQAAQAHISATVDITPGLTHVRVEDGKGRRLGRTFGVKLWPTLIFLRDGQEVARVVRPADQGPLRDALHILLHDQ